MGGDNDHVIPAIVAGSITTLSPVLPVMEALWLWVGSASHRSCGNWLAEAGFSTDTPVMVSVEQEQL